MKFTHLGLVLMPVIFLVSSVAFYALNGHVYAASCFLWAVIFCFVLISENSKK